MGFGWGSGGLTWVEYKGSMQTRREVWTEMFLPQSASHSPPAIRLIIGDCRAALEFGLPFYTLIEDKGIDLPPHAMLNRPTNTYKNRATIHHGTHNNDI